MLPYPQWQFLLRCYTTKHRNGDQADVIHMAREQEPSSASGEAENKWDRVLNLVILFNNFLI